MAHQPAQDRRLVARLAAHSSWARTNDRTARTAPARQALIKRFEDDVDPNRLLSVEQRLARAESARRAFYLALARKSAQVRRERAQAKASGQS